MSEVVQASKPLALEWTNDSTFPSNVPNLDNLVKSNSSSNFRIKYFSPMRPKTSVYNPSSFCERPLSPLTLTYSCPKETLLDLRRRVAREKCLDDITLLNAVKANYRFIYRINDGVGTTNTILQQVCDERGWREFQETSLMSGTPYERAMRGATGWNLWWSYSIYQFSPYKYLRQWQFTNHNPKGFQFCNKLYLTMYLRKMKAIHGAVFDFYPLSFIVPEDYLRLSLEHARRASESFTMFNFCNLLCDSPMFVGKPTPMPMTVNTIANHIIRRTRTPVVKPRTPAAIPSTANDYKFYPVWISKPVAQSQGKGIFLTTDLSTIATDRKSVVQEYISRPMLIGGYKWDVRIYVCVSAIDPLVIYIYHEGLCRFCTEKYDTADLAQMYSHLTNVSLNKLSPAYEKDKELIGQGCKWSLRRLRQFFKERNIGDWLLWQKIMAMVVLTVIGDSLRLGYSASNRNCFDLFGFDVLVDDDMKPWLLECNYSPGLGGDCETDVIVKKPMLHDLFNLLGFPNKSDYENEQKNRKGRNPVAVVSDGGGDKSEETVTIDRDEVTKQYFDLLIHRLKVADSNEDIKDRKRDGRWRPQSLYTTEARLHDAKSIYSQNLVVQYLKNQSTGKISKQVRDQLISVASKKLRSKMAHIGGTLANVSTANLQGKPGPGDKKPTKNQLHWQAIPVDNDRIDTENNNKRTSSKESIQSQTKPPEKSEEKSEKKKTKVKEEKVTNTQPTSNTEQRPKTAKKEKDKLKDVPDSEAFQKLKYYFDAGVDYPMDLKTGRFKEFPALLTVKKDWFNPPKQEGGWIRVYPFDARTTKSPYKSSLTDIRQAVRAMENYMKTAEHVFNMSPNETDEYFKRRMRNICRRDTEIWIPPLQRPTSSNSDEDRPNTASSSGTSPTNNFPEEGEWGKVEVIVTENE